MKKPLIVVTGGSGYIGSHTLIELIQQGYDVVSIDNHSRSSEVAFTCIEKITGNSVKNYDIDICNQEALEIVFSELPEVTGVIHFAAYKSVPESVAHPEVYYHNNLISLINVLNAIIKFNVPHFVFSSSCSVYGDISQLPVSEETPLSTPKSPYAVTKIMGERIVEDTCKAHSIGSMCLRYFNPVGAHTSGLIGEMPLSKPDNLIPVITQTAIGKRSDFVVFGGNLPTRDGSCIRDFVHVQDIASAHVLALKHLEANANPFHIINLGTGSGVSIFEAIDTFEQISGLSLSYQVGEAREGDVVEIFSNVEKAQRILGWQPVYTIKDMMASAWKWELQLKAMEEEGILVK